MYPQFMHIDNTIISQQKTIKNPQNFTRANYMYFQRVNVSDKKFVSSKWALKSPIKTVVFNRTFCLGGFGTRSQLPWFLPLLKCGIIHFSFQFLRTITLRIATFSREFRLLLKTNVASSENTVPRLRVRVKPKSREFSEFEFDSEFEFTSLISWNFFKSGAVLRIQVKILWNF